LISDEFNSLHISGKSGVNTLKVRARIKAKSTGGSSSDQDTIISLAGEVVDRIENNPSLSNTNAGVQAKLTRISYSLEGARTVQYWHAELFINIRFARMTSKA